MKKASKPLGAIYLNSRESKKISQRTTSTFSLIVCSLLAFMVLASTIAFVAVDVKPQTVYADGCDPENGENNCDFENVDNGGSTEDDVEKAAESADPPSGEIPYLLWRLFRIGYMNDGRKAVIPGDATDPRYSSGWNCSSSDHRAGTLLYHNCDVPNFLTGVVQGFAEKFIPQGPQNAEQESAFMGEIDDEGGAPWGLSYYTPKNVNPNTKVKYTALELYGYNLKYTSYKGEWDFIEVMTSARALAGFSTFDKIKLIFKAGIAAIGNFVVGTLCFWCDDPVEPGSKVILDTSDTNVFTQNAWYRPNFGATMYGIRELSDSEISELIIYDLTNKLATDEAKDTYPEFDGIAPTLNDIKMGSCSWRGDKAPADAETYTLKACFKYFESLPHPPAAKEDVTFVAPETILEWRNRVWGAAADKYDLCTEFDVNLTWGQQRTPGEVEQIRACLKGKMTDKYLELVSQFSVLGNFTSLLGSPEDAIATMVAAQQGRYFKPQNRYVCLNPDGTDLKGVAAGGRDQYVFLYLNDGKNVNPKCYESDTQFRAPIQNGFFGNGYTQDQPDAQISNIVNDPRRAQFEPGLFETIFRINLLGMFAGIFLTLSSFVTKISNTVLNLALSPILDSLGIKQIIVSMIESLRDSIFYPLIILAIAFAGIVIFVDALRNRNYLEQIKNVIIVLLTFVFAVAILESPKPILNAIDKGPAYVEAVIVGSIFNVSSSDEDNVCKASAADPATAAVGWEGEDLPFDPEASSRLILCENWRAFLFAPYVYGQWGTDYGSLYADQMENDNENLVGRPIVRLGGGDDNSTAAQRKYWEENWALYQVDTLLTGTTTNPDSSNPADAVSRDFYRIVDLQAHPALNYDQIKIGEPDSRYLNMWAGNNLGERALISFLAFILAIMGLITVTIYSFAKITVSILTALMLIFAPFMFLIGVVPKFGRTRLKKYVETLVALMIQRILLTTLLAMMMRLITVMATTTTNFYQYFMLGMAICAAFLTYRKELIGLFTKTTQETIGNLQQNLKGKNGYYFNRFIDQNIREKRLLAGGVVTGAAGGFLAGGFKGASTGISRNWAHAQRRSDLKSRREGHHLLRAIKDASDAGSHTGAKRSAERLGIGEAYLKDKIYDKKFAGKEDFEVGEAREFIDENIEANKDYSNAERRTIIKIGKKEQKSLKKGEKFEDRSRDLLRKVKHLKLEKYKAKDTDDDREKKLVANYNDFVKLNQENMNHRKNYNAKTRKRLEAYVDTHIEKKYKDIGDNFDKRQAEEAEEERIKKATERETERMTKTTFTPSANRDEI